jgi:hypothetical protein
MQGLLQQVSILSAVYARWKPSTLKNVSVYVVYPKLRVFERHQSVLTISFVTSSWTRCIRVPHGTDWALLGSCGSYDRQFVCILVAIIRHIRCRTV